MLIKKNNMLVRFLAIVALFSSGLTQVNAIGFSDRQYIESLLDQKMRLDGIPGLSFSIVEDGELSWELALGMANIEHATKATNATVYRSASLVKPLTATAILQLSLQNKIDLDEPVWNYCKEYPQKEHNVTSRDLLTHTSGVRSYSMPWTRFEAELFSTKPYASISEALSIFSADPLLHEPGTAFKYSSYGYNLLGCVIESASGKSFSDYLQSNIFQPAGMYSTRLASTRSVIINRAGTYRRDKKGMLVNERYVDLSNKYPSGGLLTTASDMARFAIAYMSGELIPLETVKQAIAPTVLADGSTSYYAMGWDISKVDRQRIGHEMFHNGSTPGVSGIMYLFPDTKSALVMFANLYGVEEKEQTMQTIANALELRAEPPEQKMSSLYSR